MYYKAPDNSIHSLDSVVFEHLLPTGSVRLSDGEAQTLIAAAAAPSQASIQLETLSPRQIRMALTQAGLREAVESAVAAGGQELKDWWGYSTYFARSHPQVAAMATALNVSDAQLDALWVLGASL